MRAAIVVVTVCSVCPPQHMVHLSDPSVEVLVIAELGVPVLAASSLQGLGGASRGFGTVRPIEAPARI